MHDSQGRKVHDSQGREVHDKEERGGLCWWLKVSSFWLKNVRICVSGLVVSLLN